MPLQATSGAASYDAFGGGVPVVPKYIEEYFSTFLYSGSGGSTSITNNIDLSTKGGLVWIKSRGNTNSHWLWDTARGTFNGISSNSTSSTTSFGGISAFNSDGFSLGSDSATNGSGVNFASWSFAKAPKFFDVVTYTGNGVAGRTISHNLGSVPGCIFVKQTNVSGENWDVYHRSLANNKQLYLNTTDAQLTTSSWNSTTPTSTVFTVGDGSSINANGSTYVAYLFAHNAGGFGLTGTDNVISCGSFTTNGSGNATVNLGYEPQWVVIKNTTSPENWFLNDIMRGMPAPPSGSGTNVNLFPNTSSAESIQGYDTSPTSTGFDARTGNPSKTYIYIAIRRGPMKVPTSGTSVFAPVLNTGTGANTNISSGGFAPDMLWNKTTDHSYGTETWDKLRGVRAVGLTTSNTGAEGLSPAGYDLVSFNNTGVTEGANSGSVMNISSWLYVNYMFGRAPSFFDEVCYTASGSSIKNHNLGVAPEFIITKSRNLAQNWIVTANLGANGKQFTAINTSAATYSDNFSSYATSTTIDTSVFAFNDVGYNYVAYLFATCAGVSKVGSYTGTATTLQIDCGFTGGARFVLIKRTDSTGDWYVWDSARGIIAGNDPYLLLNSTAAEVTNTDYVDTYNAGFEISSTAPAAINASGGSFIFLAIA